MQYAPIVIPTLNRAKHLQDCLESLEKCSGADKTIVYVGLDYPPSEKYQEGWKTADAYLKEKEQNNSFQKLVVIRRPYNYGLGHENSNGRVLLREVFEKHDRYIFTEDDNVFSPNFLEYINWGLETYENDKSIYAICGYNRVQVGDIKSNVYAYPRFNGWGYGGWRSRYEKLNGYRNLVKLKEIVDGYPFFLYNARKIVNSMYILNMLKNHTVYGDAIPDLLPEDEMRCVLPTISKVLNNGHDGTGAHGGNISGKESPFNHIPFDKDEHFTPRIEGELYKKSLRKVYNKMYNTSFVDKMYYLMRFQFYKLTGSIFDLYRNEKGHICVKTTKVTI